jgi:hypothetical protein
LASAKEVIMQTSVIIVAVALASGVLALGAKADNARLSSGWKFTGDVSEVGPERSYVTGVYWGMSFNDAGQGFAHQMAWNCPVVGEIDGGTLDAKGLCTMVDAEGDKIFATFARSAPVGGRFAGEQTYTAGSGKYEGISGGHKFDCAGITADQLFCSQEAEYKVP